MSAPSRLSSSANMNRPSKMFSVIKDLALAIDAHPDRQRQEVRGETGEGQRTDVHGRAAGRHAAPGTSVRVVHLPPGLGDLVERDLEPACGRIRDTSRLPWSSPLRSPRAGDDPVADRCRGQRA
jgi:hypothetical protein